MKLSGVLFALAFVVMVLFRYQPELFFGETEVVHPLPPLVNMKEVCAQPGALKPAWCEAQPDPQPAPLTPLPRLRPIAR